jgi:hypothetical protein
MLKDIPMVLFNFSFSVCRYFSKWARLCRHCTGLQIVLAAVLFLLSGKGLAEPSFEGYYKFYLGKMHTGYFIQRNEYDTSKKEHVAKYFIFVKSPAGSTTESLVARANDSFGPISMSYSALVEGSPKSVDASVKGKRIVVNERADDKTATRTEELAKDGFFSIFLNYIMLGNGLSKGKNYSFTAFSEEDGRFVRGGAKVLTEHKVSGVPSYKVQIEFKNSVFESYLSHKGEVLGTVAAMQNATTELVPSKEAAVQNFSFPDKSIRAIFGNIPEGKKNSVYEMSQTKNSNTESPLSLGKPSSNDVNMTDKNKIKTLDSDSDRKKQGNK